MIRSMMELWWDLLGMVRASCVTSWRSSTDTGHGSDGMRDRQKRGIERTERERERDEDEVGWDLDWARGKQPKAECIIPYRAVFYAVWAINTARLSWTISFLHSDKRMNEHGIDP
jgi:hypothetical protein